ncbi:peptidase family M28 [Colletotrichum paranaense]|uniref:Peptide hydrolase n=10 Tax=Colletotrichum acutatum species complex TaxID=2707335 RepID=A0A9Q0B5M8_9PEZI|nr:peptidase family M28 [Colletotrichum lupini]XP_060304983.1 peptidase family M28 [Colletotrichum costaricense]XP_060353402.1 peptidase family M28 [Colletotrichum paranaense]XP_060386700.1 peptidase family M28 [Colletotrichum tamarilloi]XP_060402097.1 peptidase family M28 [Colletotrichum abscissum]KAK0382174.1 peptidase family M28 [Colletotrichum limetticola]KAK1447699.1 peptidase family M28 [Colletotrichum melonis]KAK1465429.1 peptidase family M28 [Colletotrichum cuscutae]KXH40511.1 pepti
MKVAKALPLAVLAHSVSARFVAEEEINRVQLYPAGSEPEKYLIELAPGNTRWVTEEEKWELRRNGNRFFDITDHKEFGANRLHTKTKKSVFPEKCRLQDKVKPLIKDLDKKEIQTNLEKFTSFHTRYFKSDYGRQSSEWLLAKLNTIIKDAGADKHVYAEAFPHTWQQSSIIVTIPGKSNSTVVIGAHQDSINLWLPSILAAPGADDDGSGSMTILEAFRTLLKSKDVISGKADNTIEFHWYSAEEGGLLGSQAIFSSYEQDGRDIKAMLQQDMTGFVQGTLDAGKPESVGVITDFVDPGLTGFIKKVIVEYCKVPYVETKCGYACSDHASASKAGYPSAFVIESAFEDSDKHIHSTDDNIKYLSFDHMLEHAKMTLGLVYELGFTDFAALEKQGQVSEEL